MKIGLFGSSADKLDISYFEKAAALAAALSLKKYDIVYGGGKHGLVGFFVKSLGPQTGSVTGVTTKAFAEFGDVYNQCTELIIADDIKSRIDRITGLSDCFLVLPGGIGTFEEFFSVLSADMLGTIAKPVIIFNINNSYYHLIELLKSSVTAGFSSKACLDYIYDCKSVSEVLDALSDISSKSYAKRSADNYHS